MGCRQNMNSGIAICMFQILQASNYNIQSGLAVWCGCRWVALVVVGEEICAVPWWFHAGFMPCCSNYDLLPSVQNWDFWVAEF